MMITQLTYSNTNTYLIRGSKGSLLFDTGWAGTFPLFCKALGENKASLQEIKYLLISHYHPDHMGIAQEIALHGVTIVVPDVQREFIHSSDAVFRKENNRAFIPISDSDIRLISIEESRKFLSEIELNGEIIHTPGHSDDSISLWLDEGYLFVGDLNPLYELDMHKGTQIAESWDKLMRYKPSYVYYGHAKAADLTEKKKKRLFGSKDKPQRETNVYALTELIIKYIDKGCTTEEIRRKTGADAVFISDVARMYITHPNVSIQGILDRIEIKGK